MSNFRLTWWAATFTLAAFVAGAGPSLARASGPPLLGSAWSLSVLSNSARLSAEVDPNGLPTAVHFDYLTEAAYQANIDSGKDGFTGAAKAPPVSDVDIGSGSVPLTVIPQLLAGLAPGTAYRYRVAARNSASSPGYLTSTPHTFVTAAGGGPLLLDSRGWEMVSPIEKNGGQVDPPGSLGGGGVIQAAADGDSVTYSSGTSFGAADGAPSASQYLATRGDNDWQTENISVPTIFSGSYDTTDHGVPYQLFSTDLSRSLLSGGDHCRGANHADCPVANPPLPGTDAPPGYRNYYLREANAFTALFTSNDLLYLRFGPADFDLRFAGAAPDLSHVILSTCAALTADAAEVTLGSSCDPTEQNLYRWSVGSGLAPSAINGAIPGAALAAPGGAVSSGGSVYFTRGGDLYLRNGVAQAVQVDADAGGGGSFQAASSDGSIIFFTVGTDLWRYSDFSGHAVQIASGVTGVLGASETGDTAYFQDGSGLQRWHSGATAVVASGTDAADPSDYPPAAGTSRVSADGTKLLFISRAELTGFDNTDLNIGAPDSQVYLYDSTGSTLTCISCNPTNERPVGPSTIPGAIANGSAPGSTDAYKPRALSADGRRVFFDSGDALVLTDTNSDHSSGAGMRDAYEWEAQGEGGCERPGGCLALLSSGRNAHGSSFVDASADGSDAFFLTDDSLVPSDPGALDLYDARENGGFPVPPSPIPCEGDACQPLSSPPADPTLTTLLSGHGNPPVRYHRLNCRPGFTRRKQRCIRKKKAHHRPKHRHPHVQGGRR